MSAKGCSPDNAAAEGFFGRLKQEFYYNQNHQDDSIDEFIDALEAYLVWYRDERVLLQCLFSRLISIFPQCGRMVFPGLVIMQSVM